MAEDKKDKQDEEKQDEVKPTKLEVSPAQVTGGALASVTAAFLGSKLGVAGTFLGAGLTSVVITVGGAVYQRSLEATKKKADAAAAKAALLRAKKQTLLGGQKVSAQGVAPPSTGDSAEGAAPVAADPSQQVTRQIRPLASSPTSGMHWPGGEYVVDKPSGHVDQGKTPVEEDAVTRRLRWKSITGEEATTRLPVEGAEAATQLSGIAAEATTRLPAEDEGATRRIGPGGDADSPDHAVSGKAPRYSLRGIRWGLVAVTSGLAFVLCMLIITGFEGVTGRPLSGGQSGTTLGRVVRPAPPPERPAPKHEDPAPERTSEKPKPSSTVEQTTGTTAPPTGAPELPSSPPSSPETTSQAPSSSPATTSQQPSETAPPPGDGFPVPTPVR